MDEQATKYGRAGDRSDGRGSLLCAWMGAGTSGESRACERRIRRSRATAAVVVVAAIGLAAGLEAFGAPLISNIVGASHSANCRHRCGARRQPAAKTASARGVNRNAATLLGTVRAPGRTTTYYFQYGRTKRYGSRTASGRIPRSHRRALGVRELAKGLRTDTTYHYRIVATTCRGCRGGTRFGADRTFRTWPPLPGVNTGGARAVTQTSATINGSLNARGRAVRYHFDYGPTPRLGSSTAGKRGGSGRKRRGVAAGLAGLRPGTAYYYRLVVTNCGGCARGTAYGPSHTLHTSQPALPAASTPQAQAALRAVATYEAMQQSFYAANVYPGDTTRLYAGTYPHGDQKYSFLWPFTRALVGTLTLAGIPSRLVGGASYAGDAADRIAAVDEYWDSGSSGPGYDSYPPAPVGTGGDKYYDDQAWVGLAFAHYYEMTGTPSLLAGAERTFDFVYPGGWDGNGADFDPGGIYWAQQGVGIGTSNHDRATAANVPTAELGYDLAALDPARATGFQAGAASMYQWVNHYVYNVPVNPTDTAGPNPNYDPRRPPLVWGPVRDGHVEPSAWTYNQGAMVATNVFAYRRTGDPRYLADAETLARTALSNFSESYYVSQPAAFNAIYFRGLLQLYSVTPDTSLRDEILQEARQYADDAWTNYRDAQGLFHFPHSAGTRAQLLDQGAMLQLFSALGWDPADYPKLP